MLRSCFRDIPFVILVGFSLFFSVFPVSADSEPVGSMVTTVAAGENGAMIPVIKDQLLISFSETGKKQIDGFFKDYGLNLVSRYDRRGLYLVQTDRSKTATMGRGRVVGRERFEDILNRIAADSRVDYVSPNAVLESNDYFVPNDNDWQYQWNLRRWDMLAMQWVWTDNMGSYDVIVSILDSGVAYEEYVDDYHQYHQMAEFAGTYFVPGYDFVNDDEHPNDDFNHGTHIAGIVCAGLNNGIGIAGMAPKCAIMPVKILDDQGRGTVFDLIRAIDFSVENGADVINMSVSFPVIYIPGEALYRAVRDAYEAGVILVASSGNDGLSRVCYPAAFNECIAVGAVNSKFLIPQRAEYSNWGDALDVMAPGGDTEDRDKNGYPDAILSTGFTTGVPEEGAGYWFGCGTSQAAAHVTAAAALLVADGANHRDVVRNALCKSATDMGMKGWDRETGYGLISPYRALNKWDLMEVDSLQNMGGYVEGLTGTGLPGDFVGLVISFPDRIACFLEAEDGFFAFVDWNPPVSDSIAVYRLPGMTPEDFINLPGGPFEYIEENGGIIQWLDDTGVLIQYLDDTGGIIQFLDDTGGIILFLDDTGGIILFLDDTGDFIGYFNENGGIIQWLDDTGGIIQWLDDTGGIVLFLDDTGGLFGVMDTSTMEYAGAVDLEGNSVDPLEGLLLDNMEMFSPEG